MSDDKTAERLVGGGGGGGKVGRENCTYGYIIYVYIYIYMYVYINTIYVYVNRALGGRVGVKSVLYPVPFQAVLIR